MIRLRLLLSAGLLAALVLSLATSSWEARLTYKDHVYVMDLGRRPIWSPPATPSHGQFRQEFRDSNGFPPPGAPVSIQVGVALEPLVYAVILSSWPAMFLCGLMYRLRRGTRRDWVLHLAFHVGLGFVFGVAAGFVAWCLLGGWGPPSGIILLGPLGGIATGYASFLASTASTKRNQQRSGERPLDRRDETP